MYIYLKHSCVIALLVARESEDRLSSRPSRGDGGGGLVVGGVVGGAGLLVGGGVKNSKFEFKFRKFKFQFVWGYTCTSWTLCEEFDSDLEEWVKIIRARVG